MLLGYEVIRFFAKPLPDGMENLDQLEEAALIGFNVHAKRQNQTLITKDEMVSWFDDLDTYTDVINAVKHFAENFTQRVSGEDQTSDLKAKKK